MDDDSLNNSEDMLETPESFEDAYNAHSSAIYKFMFWRTKDAQVSEDLTSTTFQKAWASRKNFKGGSRQAWLFRIARNTLFDYWRKSKDVAYDNMAELEADETVSTAEVLDKQIEVEKLQKAFKKLPEEMRKVVELRFIEGLSSKQVAKKLGIEDGNVRIIQYRALKKLREFLK